MNRAELDLWLSIYDRQREEQRREAEVAVRHEEVRRVFPEEFK